MDIGKGDQAMMAWWNMINGKLSKDDVKKTTMALIEYCKMDTYAMVAIYMKLSQFLP